jgi:hypothetical protein
MLPSIKNHRPLSTQKEDIIELHDNESANLFLWLDDVRPAPEGYIQSNTSRTMIARLDLLHRADKRVTLLSLDHDLGDDNGTGYDVLLWIEQKTALDATYHPPQTIAIHSDNAGARGNMLRAIVSIENIYEGRKRDTERCPAPVQD